MTFHDCVKIKSMAFVGCLILVNKKDKGGDGHGDEARVDRMQLQGFLAQTLPWELQIIHDLFSSSSISKLGFCNTQIP